jgi:hypothetical protein
MNKQHNLVHIRVAPTIHELYFHLSAAVAILDHDEDLMNVSSEASSSEYDRAMFAAGREVALPHVRTILATTNSQNGVAADLGLVAGEKIRTLTAEALRVLGATPYTHGRRLYVAEKMRVAREIAVMALLHRAARKAA